MFMVYYRKLNLLSRLNLDTKTPLKRGVLLQLFKIRTQNLRDIYRAFFGLIILNDGEDGPLGENRAVYGMD